MHAVHARPFPYLIALLAMALYGALFVGRTQGSLDARPFIVLGTSNTPGNRGYDGQYYYRIAVAPLGGRHGLDHPAYRYQRIGYPLLARGLALGAQERIPATLVLVNVLAIGAGALCVALLLRGNGLSALYTLGYALYAGQAGSFWRDLAEPLAFALAGLALLLLRRERIWPACLALLAAGLTKETALLFAVALALHLGAHANWRGLVALLVCVALPYAAWQGALWLALGQTGVAGADHPPGLPLGGLAGVRGTRQLLADLLVVVLPALLSLGLVWADLRAGRVALPGAGRVAQWRHAAWRALTSFPTLALLANLAFALWLPARSYADLWAAARNADGLVLAALTHPALADAPRLRWVLLALWACSAPLLSLQ